MEGEAQCYNKACGMKFNPDENDNDECTYHPGTPIFHDAYKSWSCCKKRSTDFTTFLNAVGCTKGRHNPEKPPEVLKQTHESDNDIVIIGNRKPENLPRPKYDSPLRRLSVIVAQSLKDALEKDEEKKNSELGIVEDCEEYVEGVRVGESCKNNACNGVYEGLDSNTEECIHHPGVPIFHEGLKYWSCCKRRTTDFNEFLEQKGCVVASHLWAKMTAKITNCRYDWHQTGSHVYISVYTKNAQPRFTYVDANPIRLKPNIVFGDDELFEMDLELRGVINVDESCVIMAATKVEMKLRKAEPHNWSNLYIQKDVKKAESAEIENKTKIEDLGDDFDTVDLNDL